MKKYCRHLLPLLGFLMGLFLLVSCAARGPTVSPPVSGAPGNVPSLPDKAEMSSVKEFISPLDVLPERVTKKPFGLKISPNNSPISPEKFTGYHTGTDFETFTSEQERDIMVRSICTGPILVKKWATGYGGVLVQKCQLDNEDITVIYGHVKIESVTNVLGSVLQSGEQIGILGKGFSTETDGERKHLHLGIHRGSTVNIRGYVSSPGELREWIDPIEHLKT